MRSPRRRRTILALLGCAAAVAAAAPIYAVSAPDATRAPDLRADPVANIVGPGVYTDTEAGTGAGRLLVRFDGYVTNVGNGPLEIRGDPQLPQSDPQGVKQYAWSSGQGPGEVPSEVPAAAAPVLKFETADSHDHFHLMNAMKYSLWNLDKTAEVAPGQKVGFCLYDLQTAPNPPPGLTPDPQTYIDSVTHYCEWKQPSSHSLRMGVSSGWRDVYDRSLAFQWVDVSETSPGTYLVASEADPGNTIWEGGFAGSETNLRAFASEKVTVPGYVAKPVTLSQTGGRQTIALASTKFGAPGAVAYRIVAGPSHGTLDPISGGAVTYQPSPGYSGPDGFTYVARDATSDFPLAGSEPTATVSIYSAKPSVAISGAPATMIAGTSAQLSATVAFVPGGVTWSTTAGSISPSGLFVAPSTPPPGGTLRVRATSTADPSVTAEAVIAVTPAPPPQPAPLPGPTPVATGVASTKLLSRLTVGHVGNRVVVGTVTTGPKAGRIDVIVSLENRVLGRCGARVGARKTVSCRIVLAQAYPLTKVRFTVKLSVRGRVKAVRRAFVVTPRAARG